MTHPALTRQSRVRGCLLGGAIGDALGAPTEFLSLAEIRRRWPPQGVTGFEPAYETSPGAITDDTQMTLFTAEALTESACHGLNDDATIHAIHRAYQRWLQTQSNQYQPGTGHGLITIKAMHQRRAPGTTCLEALHTNTGITANNNSKGCGGVMRVAPIGLAYPNPYHLACRSAAITHGHPTGQIAAGAFAVMIATALTSTPLETAITAGRTAANTHPNGTETVDAIDRALNATNKPATPETLETIGAGWTAEEALAIAIWCALIQPEIDKALLLAVNHTGDTDSTGSLTGQLLGTSHGEHALPKQWRQNVQLADTIHQTADQLPDSSKTTAENNPPHP